MDERRFDAISRVIGRQSSRRGALKAALATALGGGVAALGDDAMARPAMCRPAGRYCTHNKQCCNKRCRTGKRVPIASRNICDCDAPFGMCGKMCRDLSSDVHHCGACGNQIDRETELCCDGVPTAIDEENCHACGNVCGPDDVCCEDGCKASCEPEAACANAGAVGAPCTTATDCCSLACGVEGCIEPYADCSAFTSDGVPSDDIGHCYRLYGQALGVTGLASALSCFGSDDPTPSSYSDQACSSSDECQEYADADGLQGVLGYCFEVIYIAVGGTVGPFLDAPNGACFWLYSSDAVCP